MIWRLIWAHTMAGQPQLSHCNHPQCVALCGLRTQMVGVKWPYFELGYSPRKEWFYYQKKLNYISPGMSWHIISKPQIVVAFLGIWDDHPAWTDFTFETMVSENTPKLCWEIYRHWFCMRVVMLFPFILGPPISLHHWYDRSSSLGLQHLRQGLILSSPSYIMLCLYVHWHITSCDIY